MDTVPLIEIALLRPQWPRFEMARILYFADLVDTLGRASEEVRAPVNKQFVNLDAPVAPADEMALAGTLRP